MSDLNKVMLIGRLGQDPEMKYTASGSAIANISVATGESWNDKQTGEKVQKTEWHRVVAFQRLAEIMGEYLKKGSQVYIEGKLQTRKWQDQNGQDRWTTEIVAQKMSMLGAKPEGNGAARPSDNGFRNRDNAPPPDDSDFADDDIPF